MGTHIINIAQCVHMSCEIQSNAVKLVREVKCTNGDTPYKYCKPCTLRHEKYTVRDHMEITCQRRTFCSDNSVCALHKSWR